MANSRCDDGDDGPAWVRIAAGALIGVAVGGLLGLLLAPKPGSELRGDLKDKAEQALDDLQNATAELSARTRQLLDQTRDNLSASVEAGREAYVRTKEELTARLDG